MVPAYNSNTVPSQEKTADVQLLLRLNLSCLNKEISGNLSSNHCRHNTPKRARPCCVNKRVRYRHTCNIGDRRVYSVEYTHASIANDLHV